MRSRSPLVSAPVASPTRDVRNFSDLPPLWIAHDTDTMMLAWMRDGDIDNAVRSYLQRVADSKHLELSVRVVDFTNAGEAMLIPVNAQELVLLSAMLATVSSMMVKKGLAAAKLPTLQSCSTRMDALRRFAAEGWDSVQEKVSNGTFRRVLTAVKDVVDDVEETKLELYAKAIATAKVRLVHVRVHELGVLGPQVLAKYLEPVISHEVAVATPDPYVAKRWALYAAEVPHDATHDDVLRVVSALHIECSMELAATVDRLYALEGVTAPRTEITHMLAAVLLANERCEPHSWLVRLMRHLPDRLRACAVTTLTLRGLCDAPPATSPPSTPLVFALMFSRVLALASDANTDIDAFARRIELEATKDDASFREAVERETETNLKTFKMQQVLGLDVEEEHQRQTALAVWMATLVGDAVRTVRFLTVDDTFVVGKGLHKAPESIGERAGEYEFLAKPDAGEDTSLASSVVKYHFEDSNKYTSSSLAKDHVKVDVLEGALENFERWAREVVETEKKKKARKRKEREGDAIVAAKHAYRSSIGR